MVAAIGLAFVPFALAGKIGLSAQVIVTGVAVGLLFGTIFASWFAATSFAAARDTATLKPRNDDRRG